MRLLKLCVVLLLLGGSAPSVAPSHAIADEQTLLKLLVGSLERVDDPDQQAALLQGMLSGLAGRRNVTPPEKWKQVSAKLAESDNERVRELTDQLAQIFGDASAARRAIKMLLDSKASLADRRRALAGLLQQKNRDIIPPLIQLLDDDKLRGDAIRGFAAIEHEPAARLLLERYDDWAPEHRKAVIETLATRKPYARELLKAIAKKQVSKQDVPVHVARSLKFLLGDRFTQVFGAFQDVSQDRNAQIAKYKKLLTPSALAAADPRRGRVIFEKTCANCHLLYGNGGKIGPDLTGSNRGNLEYILLNSVAPSYDVPDAYKMVVIQTVDGRVLNGVIAEEDAQRVVLKTVEQPRVIVLKDDIEQRRVSEKSMMPEGQLDNLKPSEVVDLIRYLQTVEQVEPAK